MGFPGRAWEPENARNQKNFGIRASFILASGSVSMIESDRVGKSGWCRLKFIMHRRRYRFACERAAVSEFRTVTTKGRCTN